MKLNFPIAFLPVLAMSILPLGCSSDTATDLGSLTVGAVTFSVEQEGDAVEAGHTSRFVLKPTAGKPDSVVGWIGVQSGEGSVKKEAHFDAADGDFDDDVVAPTPIPAGSLFWVTVTVGGVAATGSIAWKK